MRPENSSVGFTSNICNSATKDPSSDRKRSIIKSNRVSGMMMGCSDFDSELRIP